MADRQEGWAPVIAAVKTPMGLAAQALLVLSGILTFLAQRVNDDNLRILLVGVLVLFGLALVLAFVAGSKAPRPVPEIVIRTERALPTGALSRTVFLSSPMAALNDREYEDTRNLTLSVKLLLEADCNMSSVFYAGVSIETKKDFDPQDSAVVKDVEAIASCRYFILLLPKRTASSVLFEAGVALGLGKRCIYFVRERKHLPFLMQQAEQAFDNVKVYEYKTLADLKRLLTAPNTFEFAADGLSSVETPRA